MYQDKTLACKDCGKEFTFTIGEQEFYSEKGLKNEPSRCRDCRSAKRQTQRAPRELFDATCAECGTITKVPFQPKEDRPVYCDVCFKSRRA